MEAKGVVKFYLVNDRYGFVVSNADGKEYFVHESQVLSPRKKLTKGEGVSFAVGQHKGRTVAINVLPDQIFAGQTKPTVELLREALEVITNNQAAAPVVDGGFDGRN